MNLPIGGGLLHPIAQAAVAQDQSAADKATLSAGGEHASLCRVSMS